LVVGAAAGVFGDSLDGPMSLPTGFQPKEAAMRKPPRRR
jgi:hypothetical protein